MRYSFTKLYDIKPPMVAEATLGARDAAGQFEGFRRGGGFLPQVTLVTPAKAGISCQLAEHRARPQLSLG